MPAFTRAESVSLLRSRCPDLAAGGRGPDRRAPGRPAPGGGPGRGVARRPGPDVDAALDALPGTDRRPWESVWDLARDRLAADDPTALALLTLAAWLGPAPVPLALLTDHPDVLPEPLAAAARTPGLADHAALLRRRGLARVTADDLLLHPMAAGLLIDRTADEHADDGGWTAIAVRLLAAAAPDRPARDRGTWPTWRWLLPHVLAATDPARRLETVAADVGHAARRRRHLPGGARPLPGRPGPARRRARVRRRRPAAGRRWAGDADQPASEQTDAR